MISPQEPAGNNYYYPTRGTTRVSVTHPASAYAYWRARIGEEIAADIELLTKAIEGDDDCHCPKAYTLAAKVARGL